MTETTTVQIAENSQEKIALDLLRIISAFEDKSLNGSGRTFNPDRKYILDTYAEILLTIRNPGGRF